MKAKLNLKNVKIEFEVDGLTADDVANGVDLKDHLIDGLLRTFERNRTAPGSEFKHERFETQPDDADGAA